MLYTIYTKIDKSLGLQYTGFMPKTKKTQPNSSEKSNQQSGQSKIDLNDFFISAKELRQNFSAALDSLEENRYFIVTRYGRPQGVLVDFKYFTPRMTMSEEEWSRGFDKMREIVGQSQGNMTEQEAYDFIDEVKQEIRAEKRSAQAAPAGSAKKSDIAQKGRVDD